MATRVPIQETYEIPSRGKIYTDMEVPASFTLRAMTTIEEKMRLSGQGVEVIPKLIQACIVSPEGIDVGRLKMFDIQFLMYKLRTVTYGSMYDMEVRCPVCGAIKKLNIDLDKIPVNYIDEAPNLVFGPLPISGDIVECKALSSADYNNITTEARRIKSKFPDYVGDPEFILTLMAKIVKVNEKEMIGADLRKYVESMNMQDNRFLESKYDDALNSIGLDTEMTEICGTCGNEFKFQIAPDTEFFRPKY